MGEGMEWWYLFWIKRVLGYVLSFSGAAEGVALFVDSGIRIRMVA